MYTWHGLHFTGGFLPSVHPELIWSSKISGHWDKENEFNGSFPQFPPVGSCRNLSPSSSWALCVAFDTGLNFPGWDSFKELTHPGCQGSWHDSPGDFQGADMPQPPRGVWVSPAQPGGQGHDSPQPKAHTWTGQGKRGMEMSSSLWLQKQPGVSRSAGDTPVSIGWGWQGHSFGSGWAAFPLLMWWKNGALLESSSCHLSQLPSLGWDELSSNIEINHLPEVQQRWKEAPKFRKSDRNPLLFHTPSTLSI